MKGFRLIAERKAQEIFGPAAKAWWDTKNKDLDGFTPNEMWSRMPARVSVYLMNYRLDSALKR